MSLTAGLQLPFGIQPVNQVPVDSWSGPYTGAPDDLQTAIDAANTTIPAAVRFLSMQVRLVVNGESRKFWYKNGIDDADLLECIGGNGGNSATDTYFFVSGSLDGEHKSTFGGDVVISGSLSNGDGVAIGLMSHAEGRTFAVGEMSHTEGKESVAVGYSSHSEGSGTQALGYSSHAEGRQTIAGGDPYIFNIVQGGLTATITGLDASVALAGGDLAFTPIGAGGPEASVERSPSQYTIAYTEGNTIITLGSALDLTTSTGVLVNTSRGKFSHAEGYNTQAYGEYSHAQGIGTIASGSGQFVAGKYNLHGNDTSLFVIGSGTDNASRADVLRIDGNNLQVTGSLSLAGSLNISQGTNLPSGKITLNGANPGTYTVSNTLVRSNSIIILTKQTFTHSNGIVVISSRVAETSFTIRSSHNGDDDEVGYLIINP